MLCKKCNKELIPKAKYCGYCGSAINSLPTKNPFNFLKIYLLYFALTFSIVFFCYAFYRYYNYIKYETKNELLVGGHSINDNGEPNVIDDPGQPEGQDPILVYEENETKNDGETYIDFNNSYANLTIISKQDAKEKIISDSQKEKRNCNNPATLAIENDIITKYGIIGVNLCEMTVNEAQELENVIAKIYAEFPAAQTRITNLTLTNATGQNYIAIFYGLLPFASSKSINNYPLIYKTLIGLNSAYYLNWPELVRTVDISSKAGYFPPNATAYSPLAHEFGHYLSFLIQCNKYKIKDTIYFDGKQEYNLFQLIADWNQGKSSLAIIEEARRNYIAQYGDINNYDFRSSISQYAVYTDENNQYLYDETIAEAFHDYYINGSNAAKASLAIVDVLKTKLGAGN